MYKCYFFTFLFLFAESSFARISPFPNDFMPLVLVCNDTETGELVSEIYEKDGNKAWAGFITDEGKSGIISITRTDAGFETKPGEFNNFNLSIKDGDIYEISFHEANLDGSNGQALIASKEVSCSAVEE